MPERLDPDARPRPRGSDRNASLRPRLPIRLPPEPEGLARRAVSGEVGRVMGLCAVIAVAILIVVAYSLALRPRL